MSKNGRVRASEGPQEAVGITMAPPMPQEFWRSFWQGRGIEAQTGPTIAIEKKFKWKSLAFMVKHFSTWSGVKLLSF